MEKVLKRYDKLLKVKKYKDGTVTIYRESPFYSLDHKILEIQNQYLGSFKWVLRKLMTMDTTRNDIVGEAIRHNKAIRNKKDSRNMHEDLATFMVEGGSTFVN